MPKGINRFVHLNPLENGNARMLTYWWNAHLVFIVF